MRDPFMSLLPKERESVVSNPGLPIEDGYQLQGILWNSEKPQAIVNGEVVTEGSAVGGAQVIRIEKKGVTLSVNGHEVLLISDKKRRASF